MAHKGPKPRPIVDRFAEKIALTDSGCVQWLAGTNGVGYGIITLEPERGSRKAYVHRWSYEYHVGPIPDVLQLDHLCRNTLCVNPTHLEPVTRVENVLRGIGWAGVNARKTTCAQGHPFSPDNTYVSPNSGQRKCRTCARIRDRARQPRNRKAA